MHLLLLEGQAKIPVSRYEAFVQLERLAGRSDCSVRLPGVTKSYNADIADNGRQRIELIGALRLRDRLLMPTLLGQVQAVPVMSSRILWVELDRTLVFVFR